MNCTFIKIEGVEDISYILKTKCRCNGKCGDKCKCNKKECSENNDEEKGKINHCCSNNG